MKGKNIMATREEIREGIASELDGYFISCSIRETCKLYRTQDDCNHCIADNILEKLHSQGVVIKVDELPEYDNYNDLTRDLDTRIKYVAVEPLIEPFLE